MTVSPKIIITNDDPTYIDMIKELLIEEGFPDVTTVVGDRAFDVIRQHGPALVLLDVNIGTPGLGWSTLDRMKIDPTTTAIPVIICSTSRLPLEKADWLSERQVDFLEKPFTLVDLMAKITAVLGSPPT